MGKRDLGTVGVLLLGQEEYKQAIDKLKEALSEGDDVEVDKVIKHNLALAHVNLATKLIDKGTEASLLEAKQLIEDCKTQGYAADSNDNVALEQNMDSNLPTLHLKLADVYIADSKWVQAQGALKEAQSTKQGEEVKSIVNLYTQIAHNIDLKDAKAVLEEAVAYINGLDVTKKGFLQSEDMKFIAKFYGQELLNADLDTSSAMNLFTEFGLGSEEDFGSAELRLACSFRDNVSSGNKDGTVWHHLVHMLVNLQGKRGTDGLLSELVELQKAHCGLGAVDINVKCTGNADFVPEDFADSV